MLGVCVRECVRARTEDEQALYLLFESSSGYGLFERVESEEIGAELDEVQKSIVECAPSLPRSLAPSLPRSSQLGSRAGCVPSCIFMFVCAQIFQVHPDHEAQSVPPFQVCRGGSLWGECRARVRAHAHGFFLAHVSHVERARVLTLHMHAQRRC